MVKIIKKPSTINNKNTSIIFKLPLSMKKRLRLICAERNITNSVFIRESLEENIKKYEKDVITI